MRITSCLNTTIEKIEAKKFNIFIGISLGNKYFSNRDNLREFISWALGNSKSAVVILIPDKIHVFNYQVRSGYSPKRATRVALNKSEETKNLIKEIMKTFNEPERHRIVILTWSDIENDSDYQIRRGVLYREFENNLEFYSRIIEIVKETVNPEVMKLGDADYEKLASYVLDELPTLIAGFKHNGLIYNLVPYPGISKIDYLTVDLQNGTTFPEITETLKIRDKVAIVEAYAK